MKPLPLLILAFLLTAGCASHSFSEKLIPGKPFFSIRLTDSSFNGVPRHDTGYFFYLENSGMITGYRLRDGSLVDSVSSFEGSNKLRRRIEQIGFVPFDFKAEAEIAQKATKGVVLLTPDGNEYEIKFAFGRVNYTVEENEPIDYTDFYAKYDPKFAKLKELIDAFGEYYGCAELRK